MNELKRLWDGDLSPEVEETLQRSKDVLGSGVPDTIVAGPFMKKAIEELAMGDKKGKGKGGGGKRY